MTEQLTTDQTEPQTSRKTWQKPEITEVSVTEVTASIFATSGNDGTFGFSNVS
ncbi:hypothetical protein [Aquipseudomonas alcaligenes]|jgi:hypothetical protein|uniref:Paeninodin family lasso peptide n=1 Tax=Aquipseudomonas alcaligenes TaxID=43263 RepID=A0AB73HWL5_AQUAC|nr:hypothetical protein [Pseudomonas alcaligenes]MDH0142209.1 hypothetical protein [Pseudomonas alcaligenes]